MTDIKKYLSRQKSIENLPVILLFLICLLSKSITAQHFKIGLSAGFNFCQIEGDRLSGYNKKGYELGIFGLYKLREDAFIYISPSFSHYGSKINKEQPNIDYKKPLLSLEAHDINILWAYMVNFGNKKDPNILKTRAHFGIKVHNMISAESTISRVNILLKEEGISFKDIRHIYPSINIGYGLFLKNNLTVDVRLDHAVFNILKVENPDFFRLIPYQVGLNLMYNI